MLTLRPYQQESIDTLWQWMGKNKGNPLIEHATGLGKSLVIAEICKQAATIDPNVRILCITHIKELIEQNYEKIITQAPDLDVGIYSASVGKRDQTHILVGQVQSVYNKPNVLNYRDMVIIDECHRMNNTAQTQYGQLIAGLKAFNPNIRVIGLTATPFRMKGGSLLNQDLFDEIIHKYTIKDGVRDGYLTPLVSKSSVVQADTSDCPIIGGEFVAKHTQTIMDDEQLTLAVIDEVRRYAHDRKKILIFCAGVDHAQNVSRMFNEAGYKAGVITGKTDKESRARLVKNFRDGDYNVLCNRDVLTTGFDAPNVDCIVLLRPTKSAGLYIQMLGRGTRLYPGKEDCLVLDFAGNIERFGAVEKIEAPTVKNQEVVTPPQKICPDCREPSHISAKVCESCGHEWIIEEKETKLEHYDTASNAHVMEPDNKPEWVNVYDLRYSNHVSRGSGINLLKVEYICGLRLFYDYVCLEHTGFAQEKAHRWWKERQWQTDDVPETIEDALWQCGDLAIPNRILVAKDGKYWKIKDYDFAPETTDEEMKYKDVKSCYSCFNFAEGKCTEANGKIPPDEVKKTGCRKYLTDEIPFL